MSKTKYTQEQLDNAVRRAREEERERIRKFLEGWKALETGIGAIPETNDYADGWNECRKKARKLRDENIDYYLQALTQKNNE